MSASTATLQLAGDIIAAAGRQHAADTLLRELVQRDKRMSPVQAGAVARAVFSYFRWFGWLNEAEPVATKIEQAMRLSEKFDRDPKAFPDDELTQRVVPSWVAAELDVSPGWARVLQREPRAWLRAQRGQGSEVRLRLGDCVAYGDGLLADTLDYRGRQDLFRTPEFHSGLFELQDLSSQAVGFVCAPRAGETWWDACAGEGGKLLHLAALMENKGLIWASDRAEWRLRKLKRRAARARVFNYRLVPWEGGPGLPTRTKFDGVLVDAPCSGLGTWQRNPHARWTTTPEDVRELSTVQRRLLAASSAAVKPGGRLIYATCTLTRAETTEVARDFARNHPEFEPLEFAHPLDPKRPATAGLTIWPQDFGGNGMFIAAWRRCQPSRAAG